MPFGGMLGSTFNFVFENQLENLQNGDRFYYLSRTAGLNFGTELENNSFAKLMMANTDATHLPADIFSTPAFTLEVDPDAAVHRARPRRACRSDRRHHDQRRRNHAAGDPRQSRHGRPRHQLPAVHRRARHVVLGGTDGQRHPDRRARTTTRSTATAATTASKAATATTSISARSSCARSGPTARTSGWQAGDQ